MRKNNYILLQLTNGKEIVANYHKDVNKDNKFLEIVFEENKLVFTLEELESIVKTLKEF